MNVRALEKLRAPLYRVTPERRIRTMTAAAQFIDRVGFCWLFAPARGAPELPSLFEAVKGRRGMHIEDWDADSEQVWGWKSDLPAARRVYYGKALAGRPGFISREMLPYLLATSGDADFERLYARGGISYEARKIYAALSAVGPLPTMALRRAAGLDGAGGSARYHRALDELQRALFVMPVGAARETGAWHSHIYELVARWFPEQMERARRLDLQEARRALVLRYLKTVLAAPQAAIARLFGLARRDLDALLYDLERERRLQRAGDWALLPRSLSPLTVGR